MRMRDMKDKIAGLTKRCTRLEDCLKAIWLVADMELAGEQQEYKHALEDISQKCENILTKALDK